MARGTQCLSKNAPPAHSWTDTEAVRRIIYTTNAIEALNSKLRRAVRTRGHFPNDEAAMKLLQRCAFNLNQIESTPRPVDLCSLRFPRNLASQISRKTLYIWFSTTRPRTGNVRRVNGSRRKTSSQSSSKNAFKACNENGPSTEFWILPRDCSMPRLRQSPNKIPSQSSIHAHAAAGR